jgi:hypothetical protein
MSTPRLRSLEFTVEDLEPCLELLVGLIGLELVARFRHPDLDAEVAQLRSDDMTLNLLCPTDTGRGTPMPFPEVRMSQLTFTLDASEAMDPLRDRLVEGGAAVVQRDDGLIFLDNHLVNGLFGTSATFVFCPEEGDEDLVDDDPAVDGAGTEAVE